MSAPPATIQPVVKTLLIIGFMLSAALFGGTLALVAYVAWLPSERCLPGMAVGGWVQPADVSLGDWLELRRKHLGERDAYLVTPNEVVPSSYAELGIELDVPGTLAMVRERSRGSSHLDRLRLIWRARSGQEELPLLWTLDRARTATALKRIASLVEQEPVNARLDLLLHQRVEDRPGRELDVARTIQGIESGERAVTSVFAVQVSPIPARITSAMIADVDVSRVLASFETSFKGKAGPRAVNIARAARYLNETIIAPGEKLSFNEVVGERTRARGFVNAPVIVEDEMQPGVGGGVCQVATTLHAAAVFGHLDVLRRRSHSRPSGYASLGLDATVIDGEVDLVIRNPYETPLIVHAFLPSRTTLRIELLGRRPLGTVRHTYGVQDTHPFTRRVKIEPGRGAGFIKRKQKGNQGYDVISYVSLTREDGTVTRHTYRSKYYPVPEVYAVGSEELIATGLPPLPEGAVESDEEEPSEDEATEAPASVHGDREERARSVAQSRHPEPVPDPFERMKD